MGKQPAQYIILCKPGNWNDHYQLETLTLFDSEEEAQDIADRLKKCRPVGNVDQYKVVKAYKKYLNGEHVKSDKKHIQQVLDGLAALENKNVIYFNGQGYTDSFEHAEIIDRFKKKLQRPYWSYIVDYLEFFKQQAELYGTPKWERDEDSLEEYIRYADEKETDFFVAMLNLTNILLGEKHDYKTKDFYIPDYQAWEYLKERR